MTLVKQNFRTTNQATKMEMKVYEMVYSYGESPWLCLLRNGGLILNDL